jgi:hypothetical protein
MKLLVMLLTFQHLLLLGVLSLSRPSETYRLNLEIKAAQAYNTSGPCGGISPMDTQESKN